MPNCLGILGHSHRFNVPSQHFLSINTKWKHCGKLCSTFCDVAVMTAAYRVDSGLQNMPLKLCPKISFGTLGWWPSNLWWWSRIGLKAPSIEHLKRVVQVLTWPGQFQLEVSFIFSSANISCAISDLNNTMWLVFIWCFFVRIDLIHFLARCHRRQLNQS